MILDDNREISSAEMKVQIFQCDTGYCIEYQQEYEISNYKARSLSKILESVELPVKFILFGLRFQNSPLLSLQTLDEIRSSIHIIFAN